MTPPHRIEFDTHPPEPVRLALCGWLRRHGIDPDHVVIPGWIERQCDRYRVAWLAAVRDETGRIVLNEARDAAMVTERFVQLEGPPMPWPTVDG